MPIERERDRRQHDQRQFEAAELRHHQDIDTDDRHHEGGAHVAERDVGDLPFAVPQNRRLALVVRLAMEADGRLAERAPIMLGNELVDGEHPVNGGFICAGHFSHHHVGEAPVAAEDGR